MSNVLKYPEPEPLLLVRKVVKRGQSMEALKSVERLFREPFETRWMYVRRKEAHYEAVRLTNEANQELADFIKECNKAFRLVAFKSQAQIMAKVDNLCNYHN